MRAEWAGTLYPCVPGHEIVGRVSALGAHVSGVKVGDLVGVGCIVDSCKHCEDCGEGLENYCDHMVGTYNFPTPDAPGHTLGGTRSRSSCTHGMCCASVTPRRNLLPSLRCFALVSPRTRRCDIGR